MTADSPPPPPDPGESSTFSEHGHIAYQIKGNHQIQQHGSTYSAHRPFPNPETLLLGSKGQNYFFSEHGHGVYQIKENQECSNILANILPADPPTITYSPDSGDGVNRFFLEYGHVVYQIKENHECSYILANILPAGPLPPPLSRHRGWGQ